MMMLHMTSGRRGFDYYDDEPTVNDNNTGYYDERKVNTCEKKIEKKETKKSLSQVLTIIIHWPQFS
jgi:hypothetical protein